jgi:hypothetical protein
MRIDAVGLFIINRGERYEKTYFYQTGCLGCGSALFPKSHEIRSGKSRSQEAAQTHSSTAKMAGYGIRDVFSF